MSCRVLPFFASFAALLSLLLPTAAPAAPSPLAPAAQALQRKDAPRALSLLENVPESAERDLLRGVALYRLGSWEEANNALARAVERLPLLTDHALFYQARSLAKLARHAEALACCQRLQREFPQSIHYRASLLLEADSRLALKEYAVARNLYQRFIELYPTGNDAQQAAFRAALCRSEGGDTAAAAAEFRTILLAQPGSDLARQAEEQLERLATQGVTVPPLSADERLRQASTLVDLRRNDQALQLLERLLVAELPSALAPRLRLKRAQVLLKLRRFGEAERQFQGVIALADLTPELRDEAQLGLARALEKAGRDEEACAAYLILADRQPPSSLAGEALLQAALVRRFQGKPQLAVPLLERLLSGTAENSVRQRATWEKAWNLYLSRDYLAAAEAFRTAGRADAYRERALYWLSRTLSTLRQDQEAGVVARQLFDDYPTGYYTQRYAELSGSKPPQLPLLTRDHLLTLPDQPANERIRLLASLGLEEEAVRELAAQRRRSESRRQLLALARLAMEIEEFPALFTIAGTPPLAQTKRNDPLLLALTYPLGYGELLEEAARQNRLPAGLLFALTRAESQFDADALSPAGAIGLMQLMPSTARQMTTGSERSVAARLVEPAYNIRLGARHLRDLLKQYRGNTLLAVAAYNAGSNAVDRWLRTFPDLTDDEFAENIPYGETRDYVKKVLGGAELYRRLYNLDGQTLSDNELQGAPNDAPAPDGSAASP